MYKKLLEDYEKMTLDINYEKNLRKYNSTEPIVQYNYAIIIF